MATLEAVAQAIAAACGFSYVGPVGAGVFKETFEAREGELRHAIKIFRPGGDVDRIAREVKATLLCNHPNIAKLRRIDVIDVPDSEQCLYVVEEFLSGGTLAARVAIAPLSPDEAFTMGAQLIDGLEHIAGHSLVHRDIKLENIMLRADGQTPVYVDFGLVRALGESSLTKSWVGRGPGTPLFASPEQLCNDKHLIDWRADQFAIGVSLAMALFGEHPYRETATEHDGVVIDRVSLRNTPVPKSFRERVTAIGLPVLAKMVAPWPVQRFRTPDTLAAAWQAQREDRR